jgi:hypothetical protein
MNMDPDYGDGLLNVSGNILRQEIRGQIEPLLRKKKGLGQTLSTKESANRLADSVDGGTG